MFYFGPWDSPGHYLFDESGRTVYGERERLLPWGHCGQEIGIDGVLQPGCFKNNRDRWSHRGAEEQGEAVLHHKDGWTALSFWDRSVDKRGACNSTYFAQGTFSFDDMVAMAKERFAVRWNRMNFPVYL